MKTYPLLHVGKMLCLQAVKRLLQLFLIKYLQVSRDTLGIFECHRIV